MERLTESNWKQNFENVISNCKTKGEELENLACNNELKGFASDYKKLGQNAYNKYIELQGKPFDEVKRSIGEDMSFYQQQCNSYYPPVLENIKKKCKPGSRLSSMVNKAKEISKKEIIIGLLTGLLYLSGICAILFFILKVIWDYKVSEAKNKLKDLNLKDDPSKESARIEYEKKNSLKNKFFWIGICSFVIAFVSFVLIYYLS